MKRKYVQLFAVCILFASVPAAANSLYSRIGIGLVHLRAGVKASGMGNTSLALSDGLSVYQLNPASSASIQFTRFQTQFSVESADVKLNGGSGRFQDANFNSASLVLPVKRGYTVTLGIQAYSRVDFTMNQSGVDSNGTHEEIYSGNGGIDEAYLAFAGTIGKVDATKGLRYGVAADFYFGRLQRTWRVNFSNGSLAPSEDISGSYFLGAGFHAGLQWFHPRWQLGVAVRPPVDLDVETNVEYVFESESETINSKVRLPLWLGVGAGYRPSDKWHLAAEYRLQKWGGVPQDLDFGATLRDSRELGAGFEYTHSKNILDSYFKRISYRAGVTLGVLPYEDPVGESISEWLITTGLGLPFRLGSGRIDVAFEFGKRGDLASNTAEESIMRLSFSINGAERWFARNSP
jgi:opacity protein-like surface antigen